ncbi:MAG: hypothetical protein IJ011_03785 [Clostridia bacterium]|nr:hypothetical protein [Clostridia bacterium]
MDKRKVIYYSDECNDEFSVAEITAKKIDGSYEYYREKPWQRLARFFAYRMIAIPIAYIYPKLVFHHKVINREVLKPFLKEGYFIYGNHTQDIADAFIPNVLSVRKDNYVIVHPNNVSMPVLGRITPYLGAIPLPDDREAYVNFVNTIEKRIEEKKGIIIYPEAHIWPYYTKIRPFPDTSFHYPVKYGTPVFCFTNTYQKRRFGKKPRIVTYIDGPFYPDTSLHPRKQKTDLRNRVYECMCERAKLSDVEQIKYIKKEDNDG